MSNSTPIVRVDIHLHPGPPDAYQSGQVLQSPKSSNCVTRFAEEYAPVIRAVSSLVGIVGQLHGLPPLPTDPLVGSLPLPPHTPDAFEMFR
jgi:hypothetical protein